MAAASSDKPERSALISFVGGPRDGDRLQVGLPLPDSIRLAVPEWALYRLADPVARRYEHAADVDARPANAPAAEAHRAAIGERLGERHPVDTPEPAPSSADVF